MKTTTVPPTIRKGDHDSTIEEHPSYGMIGVSRYTCTPPQNFFGSSIRHHAGVTIRIGHAEKHRQLYADRYMMSKPIIEISLTEAQFGQLLSHMNVGDGVPCTIEAINFEKQPDCPEKNERQELEAEFRRKMQELDQICDAVITTAETMAQADRVPKKERVEFVKALQMLKCQIGQNLPFMASQWNEALDDMLNEAKSDLSSYTKQLLQSAGAAAVAQQLEERATKMIE